MTMQSHSDIAISFVYARSYYVKTVTKSGHLTNGKPCSTLPNQIEELLEDANASLSIDNILSSKLPPLSVYFFSSSTASTIYTYPETN